LLVAAAPLTNTIKQLQINGSGTLDIGNHALLVDRTQTSASTIRQYLVNGYNNGAWNGTGGITSLPAATTPNHLLSVGYADNRGSGSNQVLVAATVGGDADLNGKAEINDFNKLAINFNQFNVSLAAGWADGDFTYDGKVTIEDFNIL